MAINVNGGGGTKRVEFGGFGGKGRRKKCRDEQTDDSVRQLLQDEGDEDIIGVVRLGAGILPPDSVFAGCSANCFALLVRGRRGRERQSSRRLDRRRVGLQPVFELLARLSVGGLKIALRKCAILRIGVVFREICRGGRIEKQRRRLELVKDKNQERRAAGCKTASGFCTRH